MGGNKETQDDQSNLTECTPRMECSSSNVGRVEGLIVYCHYLGSSGSLNRPIPNLPPYVLRRSSEQAVVLDLSYDSNMAKMMGVCIKARFRLLLGTRANKMIEELLVMADGGWRVMTSLGGPRAVCLLVAH